MGFSVVYPRRARSGWHGPRLPRLVQATFGIFGVAPTVNRWSAPETTWLRVVTFGLVCLVVTRAVRLFDSDGVVPEPAGLLITLVGVLAVMNGLYVWAVTNGPLNDEEE